MNSKKNIVIEITICMGSSCFSRGNSHTLHALKEYISRNGLEDQVTLVGSLCEGRCHEGPNIIVDGVSYNHVAWNTVADILTHHLALSPDNSTPAANDGVNER